MILDNDPKVAERVKTLLPNAFSLVDGCFDPLHRGHVQYFRRAAELNLPVLCNVANDSYIMSSKGRAPLLQELERVSVLDAIRYIDYVYLSTRGTCWSLRNLRPTYYVKGKDWAGCLPPDQVKACEELAIEIVILDCQLESSTEILRAFLRRQRDSYGHQEI